MIDDVTALDCRSDRIKVAQVSAGKMDGESLQIIQAALGSHEANHLFAVSEQMPDEVGTDKTGSASDEDSHPRIAAAKCHRQRKREI
jgi:hypothetical protein